MNRLTQLLCALAMIIAFSLVAAPASAQPALTDCDVRIIDTTYAQVLNKTEVQSAIDRLEQTGADVRVRAFESVPGALETYQENHVSQCATWRGLGGSIKGNLVTILFSMDHKSAIFYGANFHDELDDEIDGIRSDAMGDQFRAGNFTGGVVDSLNEIADELTPTNWGIIFMWIGIAIVAMILIVLVVLAFRRRRPKASVRRRRSSSSGTAIYGGSVYSDGGGGSSGDGGGSSGGW